MKWYFPSQIWVYLFKCCLSHSNRSNKRDSEIREVVSRTTLHKKWSFPLRISLVNVTYSEEIIHGKLHFLCCDRTLQLTLHDKKRFFAKLKKALIIFANYLQQKSKVIPNARNICKVILFLPNRNFTFLIPLLLNGKKS